MPLLETSLDVSSVRLEVEALQRVRGKTIRQTC